jgi:hypothetical protein
VRPSVSGLLVHERLGALLGGGRIHLAELEDVVVGVGELSLVHEAVVSGGLPLRALLARFAVNGPSRSSLWLTIRALS